VIRAHERPDLERLIEIARAGGHAASDYLEDAVLAGVATVGCRRCGEGPVGETYVSNVVEGARIAVSLEPGIVLLEGSGAALPPVRADRTVCVAAPEIGAGSLFDLLPVRLMRSHLAAILGADRLEPAARTTLEKRIARWCDGPVIACSLEPQPVTEVPDGARVAAFTTAGAEHEQALRERLGGQGAEICVLSTSLARRERLERDLEAAERERCDVFLTELKAAAIEVVAERAQRLGAMVVFLRNRPAALAGEPDLDAALLQLAGEASAQASARVPA
jgi:cyclic 2,3-diphosphoglycerate synthetase